jgi:chromosomal replication initiation ATPase DnaA
MAGVEWLLELALTGLLAATLFHALRLERALGMLKRDRATLEGLVKGFNDSTREAEAGIERLRSAADTTGRDLAGHTAAAASLKDDLSFLTERAERLADRLDAALRAGRANDAAAQRTLTRAPVAPRAGQTPESEAERELMRAFRMAR